ncbi:hypothetical protein HPHPA9_1110 [Helicobacter pylori Hp A-9]|uniref:Uncharacterized protein n=1 Tax=Helicobacter pylori Hp A-9 TaxID=992034 RepID=J0JYH3_HELPX|nr:hypothetical protein HPHPA9_1110 [Helicobacter pylori Hp A-9]
MFFMGVILILEIIKSPLHKIPFDRNDLKSHLGSLYSNNGFI